MRDALFLLGFVPLPLLALASPWLGLLAWGWIAFQQPHRALWGFAADLPYNLIIAGATLLGWLLSRERKAPQLDLTSLLLLLFGAAIALSTTFSLAPELSAKPASEFGKNLVFLLLLANLLTTRARLHGFVWLQAFCLGYYGLMGGALFILTGGQHNFTGPSGTAIGDRNNLALALLLAVPLMNYLRLHSRQRWLQLALIGAMLMTVLAVLGTYSRGGFVGLLAMGAVLWWRSRRRLLALAAIGLVAASLAAVAPDSWKQRMGTIEQAHEVDNSFKLRLQSWYAHLNAARDRPLVGAGPYALQTAPVYFHYAPDQDVVAVVNDRPRAAHSIYFQVLGELGLTGFLLYAGLLLTAARNARWVERHSRARPELAWLHDLARMLQASLAAFLVAGAGLSMAYYDYFFALTIVLAALRRKLAAVLADAPAAGHEPLHRWSAGRVQPVRRL